MLEKELQMPAAYDLFPEEEDFISPSEYLNLTEEEKAEIKDIQIIPPALGSRGFGMFRIIRKSPSYRIKQFRKSSHGRQSNI